MVTVKDFTAADGTVDWKRMRRAEVAAGERCTTCQSVSGMPTRGAVGPQECAECRQMHESDVVMHHERIRCPKCLHTWAVRGSDDYQLFREGHHEVMCPQCEHEFAIRTYVSYRFTSPPVAGQKR